MIYEQLFLDTSDLQKFQMYRALKTIDESGFTINDLSNKLHVSYQQSYNIFRELLADLEQITGKSSKVEKKRLMSPSNFPVSIDEYRLFLLEQSLQFQFIDYMAQAVHTNVDTFCADRYISRSTLTRKTLPLRKFLERYDMGISFTSTEITGDERRIRFFLFSFYWFGFHGVRWPITAIQPQRLNDAYLHIEDAPRSPLIALQEMLFWGICRLRIVRGHLLKPWPRFDKIFTQATLLNDTVYDADMYAKLTAEQLRSESQFFRFYQLGRMRFSKTQDDWLEMYANVMDSDNPIRTYTDHLTDFLEKFRHPKALLAVSDDMALVTNIIRVATTFYLFQGPVPQLLDFYDEAREIYPHTTMYDDLLKFHRDLPSGQDMDAFKQNAVMLTQQICYILSPHLRSFTWPQLVQCKLLLEDSNVSVHKISTFLGSLSFVELMGHDEDTADADLIITFAGDRPVLSSKPKHPQTRVVWHVDADDNDYFNLYKSIKETFFKKLGLPEDYEFLQL